MTTAPASLGEDYAFCFRESGVTQTAPSKWQQLRTAKSLLPEIARFSACNHNAQKRAHSVGVYRKGNAAWLSGVYQCGSVWICPVCSRRLAEIRREQIQTSIDNAIKQGLGVSLVTLTFPHGAGDQLPETLEKFTNAQRFFKSGRVATRLRTEIGFVGEIKTLEVTHGANGWHPHTHSIWITKKILSQSELETLQEKLYDLWLHACNKKGLPPPSIEHGVDVRGARYAAEYIAKWGFAAEVAAGTSKRGKAGGRTPWQLLAEATHGDKRAACLWREFALGFFGKRQLFWSRGLRKALGLAPELTEQELLALEDTRDDPKREQVMVLDLDTWHVVRKAGAQELVLSYAVHSQIMLYALLNHLRTTIPMEDGRILGVKEEWEF